jgi:hypothetical protein
VGLAGSRLSPFSQESRHAEPGATCGDADCNDVRSSTAQLDALMQQEALARQQQLVLHNCQQLEVRRPVTQTKTNKWSTPVYSTPLFIPDTHLPQDMVRTLLDRREATPRDGQAQGESGREG